MQRTGIEVPFPVIADRSGEIARKYGMISNDVSTTETVRNVFIIDDKGIVRTIFIYPLNVGRWIPEIIRVVEALQVADCNNASTPANWIPGQPIIVPKPNTFSELQQRVKEIEQNKNGISWYLSFKKSDEKCNKQIQENKFLNKKLIKKKKKKKKTPANVKNASRLDSLLKLLFWKVIYIKLYFIIIFLKIAIL